MCTGRLDLGFILRAFSGGADGVFVGGCWPGECHYVTEGNYDALGNIYLCKRLLEQIGVSPARLRLEWVAASEGSRFAEVIDDFVGQLRELGPLGTGEGLAERELKSRLAAVTRLVPYIKLVERERLRVPVKSEEAYRELYTGEPGSRLFGDLIADKLVVSRIMLLLEARPLSTAEICEGLGLSASEVSRHMHSSSRQGLVRYDLESKRYALA